MSIDTVFYIVGGVMAVLAIALSFAGLKLKGFPSRGALGGIITIFALLVVATGGLAVAVAREEQDHRRAEQAEAEKQAGGEESAESTESTEGEAGSDQADGDESQPASAPAPTNVGGGAEGSGEVLTLAASETELAYSKSELEATAGEVTIKFDNPSAIPHDVVIEGADGNDVARTDVITESSASLSAELDSGEYTFYCSIPGHEEAGMVGTLAVE